MRILLRRDDVNPDKPNKHGETPLNCAACAGHSGVVKLLLGRNGVNPNKPDKGGRTPLWWATKNGHTGVIALLQPLTSPIHSTPKPEEALSLLPPPSTIPVTYVPFPPGPQ